MQIISKQQMPSTSRIWIFQNSFEMSDDMTAKIKELSTNFAKNWVSHQNQLASDALVLHNRFIIFIVDESVAGASGCSIDKSIAFIKYLEQEFSLNLLDRMNFAYLEENNKVKSLERIAFKEAYQQGKINENTLVFNNLITQLDELNSNWILPLKDSWHKRLI